MQDPSPPPMCIQGICAFGTELVLVGTGHILTTDFKFVPVPTLNILLEGALQLGLHDVSVSVLICIKHIFKR